MPLSGKEFDLFDSKKFRQFMLKNGSVDDLIPHLIVNGICTRADRETINFNKTSNEKMIDLLWIVERRVNSLEQFVQVLRENPNSYKAAIEMLGFSPEAETGGEPESPVSSILNNISFRSFLLKNGDPDDFIVPFRAEKILSREDQELIMSKVQNNQKMIELFDILLRRLPNVEPLITVMQNKRQTYAKGLEIIAIEGIDIPPHVLMSSGAKLPKTNLRDIKRHLKRCYKKEFGTFAALPFYKRLFNISDIWINLQLENRSAGTRSENYKDSITSALLSSALILLKGDPGMGKTMTQKRLAYDWAIGNLTEYDLVLCARFRDIQSDWETIWDLILAWMKELGYLSQQHVQWLRIQSQRCNMRCEPKKPKEVTRKVFSRIRWKRSKLNVLCILDGFDEAISDCKELHTLLTSSQMATRSSALIVTSRPFAFENINCPAPILVFSSLNNQQVNDCVRKYLRALSVEDVEGEKDKLIEKIHHYKIFHLARIPLLLSCLCFIRDQISSDSVVDIYLTICQALVDRQEDLKDTIKFTHKKLSDICVNSSSIRALSNMCFSARVGAEGFKPDTVVFNNRDLKRFEVDKDLWLKVGLLNADREEGVGKDTMYELPHATFLELLAAIALFEKLALAKLEYPIVGKFCTIESRLQTFTDWPKDKKEQSIDMALAGLYYELDVDKVRCFYCGKEATNLKPSRIPLWQQHALHSPSCPYLHQVKDFIDILIQGNKDSENVNLNVTNYNQIDQMHLPQSEPILKQVLDSIKPMSLEQVWTFLAEMAAQSDEGSNKGIYNTVSFFEVWTVHSRVVMMDNEHFFELLLRLKPKARQEEQLTDTLRTIIRFDQTPASLLHVATEAQLPIYKINDNAVYIGDLNIAILMHPHNSGAEIIAGIPKKQVLPLCLVQQNVLDSLTRTCMQMGWKKIVDLKISVTEEPVMELEKVSPQMQTKEIKVDGILLYFSLSSQSDLNLSPIFNRLTSMYAESITMRSQTSLIVNDLPMLFSNQQMKQNIKFIEVERIQFQDNKSEARFGEQIKDCTNLHSFQMRYSKMGGNELLNLIDNLACCPLSSLRILNQQCLEDASISNQLIDLLARFTKLEKLRLSHNNLSIQSVDKLCKTVKQMEVLKVIVLQDPNVKYEHLQSLRDAGLHVVMG